MILTLFKIGGDGGGGGVWQKGPLPYQFFLCNFWKLKN